MKKKFLLIITILLLSCACSSSYLKSLNLNSLKELVNNKKTFVLYLTDDKDGKVLKNNLEQISKKNKLESFYINTSKLSDDDLNALKEIFKFDETNIIIFVKDGKEDTVLSRISDVYISDEELEQELIIQGYIQKEN